MKSFRRWHTATYRLLKDILHVALHLMAWSMWPSHIWWCQIHASWAKQVGCVTNLGSWSKEHLRPSNAQCTFRFKHEKHLTSWFSNTQSGPFLLNPVECCASMPKYPDSGHDSPTLRPSAPPEFEKCVPFLACLASNPPRWHHGAGVFPCKNA